MISGKKYDWKLIFRVDETVPGQKFTCFVKTRYPFRGSFFVFSRPESFLLVSYKIGGVDQIVGDPVPCVVLNQQKLIFSASLPGHCHELTLVNNESTVPKDMTNRLVTGIRPTEFIAELCGQILVRQDETPVSTDNEVLIIN